MHSNQYSSQIGSTWLGGGAAAAFESTVHQLFAKQAHATPHAMALLTDDTAITYSELDARAERLARRLRSLGVGRGSFVGLCLERSPEVIIGLLAILKAGGAYVPLDPAYPDERLAYILHDTAAPVTLIHRATSNRFIPFAGLTRVICLDNEPTSFECEAEMGPAVQVTSDDPAYVMYTSGSTGQPKGVVVPHRAIIRLVRDTDYCDFDSQLVFLHHSPLAFDASTFEIWGPLLNGCRLALLAPGVPTPDALGVAIRRHGVTTLWLTAGLFHLVVDQRVEILAPLRQLLAGGDVLSPHHVRRALAAMRAGYLINGYGPTESTTFACCHRMAPGHDPGENVPIGLPIANTRAYVLDDEMRPVSAGTPGELFIGGDGVALGYHNLPEMTRDRFIPDPFGPEADGRLYRTGDQVRQRPDGTLEFLGRLDDQVKICGHRIEPGEIAAVLNQHPAVQQCAVAAFDMGHGKKQLVAYVVAREETSAEDLRRDLANRLPAHFVPAHFMMMDALPLNANGKVDRGALPRPSQSPASPSVPTSEWEAQIKDLCDRIFRRPVGIEDNFFDLGATSLDLIELHAEISKIHQGDLSVTELFARPTVRALGQLLGRTVDSQTDFTDGKGRARQQKEAFARRRRLVGGRM